jgi:hypothetical protein
MDANGITDTVLSRAAEISVRYVSYVKLGEKEPRRPYMAAILEACREITGRKNIVITDLFDFEVSRAA